MMQYLDLIKSYYYLLGSTECNIDQQYLDDMETNLLIIISFVAWLVPTILDTVIQINNALVVNHLAQTHIDENGRIGDTVIKLI